MNTRAIQAAFAGLLAIGLTTTVGQAKADEKPDQEKCAGVIKAGKNDCATSMNACHGHVTVDAHKEAWIYVPKGTCEKIVGAYLTAQFDPTPGAKNRGRQFPPGSLGANAKQSHRQAGRQRGCFNSRTVYDFVSKNALRQRCRMP